MRSQIPLSATILGCAAGVAMMGCEEVREDLVEKNPIAPGDTREAGEPKEPMEEAKADKDERRQVRVDVMGKSGSDLTGEAVLTQVNDGVKVEIELSNAEPGLHGFHIHQKADCSADDATSAGGHFDPRGHQHGLPDEDVKHLGDLGNIEVSKDGKAEKTIVAQGANLEEGDEHSFLGRAVMIHAKKDDGGQPTGNAGARIGCGEIPKKAEMKLSKNM